MRGIRFALAAALACGVIAAASARAEAPSVDARAEIAQALFAASATQAAAERAADARLTAARMEIDRLRAQGARAHAQLVQAQEEYVAGLLARDRAFAQEIAVLREAVRSIAATPEGAAALARYNSGDAAGALAVLDQLVDARERARQARANVETAAERRQVARLAYYAWGRDLSVWSRSFDARTRDALNELSAAASRVLSRFEDVIRLDPNVYWDWAALCHLYAFVDRDADSLRAATRAVALAPGDDERADALFEWAELLSKAGDHASARRRYEESLGIRRRLFAAEPSRESFDILRTLVLLGDTLVKLTDLARARARYEEVCELEQFSGTNCMIAMPALADIAEKQGDAPYARRISERVVSDRRAEAAAHPGDAHSLGSLVLRLRLHGDLLSRQGDFAAARTAYQEGVAVARRLGAAHPVEYPSEPYWALRHFQHALLSRRDYAGAAPLGDEVVDIARRAVAAHPGEARRRQQLARALLERAGLSIALNDPAAARTACEEAAGAMRRFAEAPPAEEYLAGEYALAVACVGDTLMAAHDLAGARARYEESRGVWIRLIQRPEGVGMPRKPLLLALVDFHLAEIELAEGRKQDAASELERVRGVFQTHAENRGADSEFQWALLGAEFRLAQARNDSAGVRRAIARLRELGRTGWPTYYNIWMDELAALAH
jgi:tetratricopeptide (TPR) repeat protein